VGRGEIHSLVGENGSGKSTLIKIISGVLPPDAGTLVWEGEARLPGSPHRAQAIGIATVFQETLIAPEMTVRDNIYLGTDRLFRYAHRKSDELAGARHALGVLGLDTLELDRPMWALSLAERQLTTVARAIIRPWRLLILDEATSALDAQQRDRLFEYLRQARSEGKSILFTSHRMDEVLDLADCITVLRTGRTVASMTVQEASRRDLLGHMSGNVQVMESAGASAGSRRQRPDPQAATAEPAVLHVEDLVLRPASQPISLAIRRGSILGLAGLECQGQVEFVECLAGLRRPASGQVAAIGSDGRPAVVRAYRGANRQGIRYVPRDRRQEGLFAPLSVFDNFAVTLWRELKWAGILRRREARVRFGEFAASSRLVTGSPRRAISTLSGGNQQKVLLGRWIAMRPRVLVVNDPLRGVDANTKEELYGLFRRLAADGIAIVFLSTEILELLTLTDQIAVFHEGSLVAMLPTEESSDTDVVAAMFGATEVEAGADG
jgi:ribose transport system ATP-binding protein